MGVYFNKNNISSLNDCIDCRCSITTKKNVNGVMQDIIETKVVNSIYCSKDGQVAKLWNRKVEEIPPFLILGSNYTSENNHHVKTMYVSDDMMSYKTLCTYGSVASNQTKYSESEYISNNNVGLLKDTEYIGSINGKFIGTITCVKDWQTSTSGYTPTSEHVGVLTYVSSDNWKWKKWDKANQFVSSKLHKIIHTGTNDVVFITGENQDGTKYQYFSKDSGNTWTQLTTVANITFNVNYKYGYFLIFTGTKFHTLNESDIDIWDKELFNNSGKSVPSGTQYVNGVAQTIPSIKSSAVIAMTKNTWFAFSDDSGKGIFTSSNNGTSWIWNTSTANYTKNDVRMVVDNGGEVYLGNIGLYSTGQNSKQYSICGGKDCRNWTSANQSLNTNLGFNENDKIGYLKSIDRFIAISSSKQLAYLLDENFTDTTMVFAIENALVPEKNITVVEKF